MGNALIVLSGPSGVGKGTVVKRLLNYGNFALSVSCTTRAARAGEADGKSYFFISREEFLSLIKQGGFLEYSEHFGNYYGTPKKFVVEKLKTHNVLLEIDVDGALQVKAAYPQALLIFLLPPDEKELRARLKKRGSESDEVIEQRIERMNYEISKKDGYDYCIVNDNLDDCVKKIEEIIRHKCG